MTIWRLRDPWNDQFAVAGFVGKWQINDVQPVCPECGKGNSIRVQPLIVEWETGSDIIGDFVWTGASPLVATEPTCSQLRKHFTGFEAGPIEMRQSPKLKKPSRASSRTKPRVWLPYDGPNLHELWITCHIHLDMQRSTVRLIKKCGRCGHAQYAIDGIETKESNYNVSRNKLIPIHNLRVPGKGMFIKKDDLEGADVFMAKEFDGWILCTDRVKKFIEERGYTNVDFLEMGDVLS